MCTGRVITLSFSSRQEVTPNPRYPSDVNARGSMRVAEPPAPFKDAPPPATVVLASIHDYRVPVAIDTLYQVFSPFGEV